MEIQQEVDLSQYNSFGVPAVAAEFAQLTQTDQLPDLLAYADKQHLPLLILGEGSNVLLVNDFPGLVVHMALTGIAWQPDCKRVTVAAGENWHEFVRSCMNNEFHGLENLALIPGSTGAAPVQNIGAYGVELEQFVHTVEVFDREQNQIRQLSHADCEFAYRDSVFKHDGGGRFIITNMTLQLGDWSPVLRYEGLREALGTEQPSPQQLFDAVCQIRQSKLPDPKSLGNAGSFFKNPVISDDKYKNLLEEIPDLKAYSSGEAGLVKVPAAQLLDTLGWKGRQRGPAGVHDDHALVLVNRGGASGEDLFLLAQEMSANVLSRFGIALQPEVRIF